MAADLLGAMRLGSRVSAEQMRSMADNSTEKQQKQRGRGRGRPFEKGQSGNPAGRPPGTGKRATQAMQCPTWTAGRDFAIENGRNAGG